MTTKRKPGRMYRKGNTCPKCGKSITYRARQCRTCIGVFKTWLNRRYGRTVRIGGRRKTPLRRFEFDGRLVEEEG